MLVCYMFHITDNQSSFPCRSGKLDETAVSQKRPCDALEADTWEQQRRKNMCLFFSCLEYRAAIWQCYNFISRRHGIQSLHVVHLSNKSAKSTQPRHFPFPPCSLSFWWLFSVSGNPGSGSVMHFKQSREADCTATRWQPALFAFPRFIWSLNTRIIRMSCPGLYFCTTAMMVPCLLPKTCFFSFTQQNFTKIEGK